MKLNSINEEVKMKNRSASYVVFCLAAAVLLVAAGPCAAAGSKCSAPIERIAPEEARKSVQAGKALLVCSYDDRKCETRLLEGALLRSEFEGRLSSLSEGQEIIFY